MGNFGRALPRFIIAFLALLLALHGLTAHAPVSSSTNNSASNPGYQNNSFLFFGSGWSLGNGGSSDYSNSDGGSGSSWFDSGSSSDGGSWSDSSGSDGGGWDSGGGDSGSWGGDGGSDSGSW